MMNSRNNAGFTLIEVLIALALVGLTLTPIFMLQGTYFSAIMRACQRIERLFLGEKFLFEAESTDQTKKIEDPLTILTYKKEAVSSNSSLRSVQDFYKKQVSISWDAPQGAQKEELVVFSYDPEKSEKS